MGLYLCPQEAASAGSGFYSKHDHCGGGGLGGGRAVVWMGPVEDGYRGLTACIACRSLVQDE